MKVQKEGRWIHPPAGVLKSNTNGSSKGNLSLAGIGGVGRSSDGRVVFFFSSFKGVHSNNLMEAVVILHALEKGCALGWKKIAYESDSQNVIDMLNTHQLEDANWQLARVIRKKLNLCSSLEYISFSHFPCEWNKVANCLAKWAMENLRRWNVEDWELLSPNYSCFLAKLIEDD
ncbi:uncharacterized protein LOC131859968 [Cryptomeria japonica]|uniref:uncharacterized protein LOC131859968 n=1 Tax=Cryptomeria japonica TaxID=3369 RepID=UPI0027DA057B|nr:uncharacterized protein LOC131859968 [Cryptomeria japonica]